MSIKLNFRSALILISLLAATAASAAPIVVENRANHVAKLELVTDYKAEIRSLADQDRSVDLLSTLEQIDGDTDFELDVRENLLEFTLLEMSRSSSTPATRAALDQYRIRPINVFVRLHEEPGQRVVPMYDLAAAATLTLRIWDAADAEAWTVAVLRDGMWRPHDYLRPRASMAVASWQTGMRRAFSTIDRRLVVAAKSELQQLQGQSIEFGSLLHVVANRLSDVDLYYQTIEFAGVAAARTAIETSHQSLTASDTIKLLINACERPNLASTAILELGNRYSDRNEVRAWLLSRLNNRRDGASAALALARIADGDILSSIESVILGDATELTKLRAALVLRLNESDAARAMRNELSNRTLSSARLQAALQ